MYYSDLMADHAVIDELGAYLLSLTLQTTAQPTAASAALRQLAKEVRDHLAVEDPMIYELGRATNGSRHAPIAAASIDDLAALKEEWLHYLYRWSPAHVARDWAAFRAETATMIERLRERVARETAILYSLGVYHELIDAGD